VNHDMTEVKGESWHYRGQRWVFLFCRAGECRWSGKLAFQNCTPGLILTSWLL